MDTKRRTQRKKRIHRGRYRCTDTETVRQTQGHKEGHRDRQRGRKADR